MATVIEEFIARLNWEVDDKAVKQFSENMKSVSIMAKRAAAAIVGATTAAVGFAVITNKQTAINTNLARSVGLSAKSFEAWTGLMDQMGFDGERLVDLVEEMNNKFGEMKGLGEMTAVSEGLRILGLEFKKIKDLAPEEQFLEILSTAKEMEDQQKAVSAVDMIMGGEANKVVGFLRTIDGDLRDIIKRRMQLNVLDEDARKGALKFNLVWSDFLALIRSIGAQFSGILGDVLTPIVNKMIDWAMANRELIKTNIRTFVERFASALRFILPKVMDLVRFIGDLVDRFGGFENVLKLTGIAISGFAFNKLSTGFGGLIKALIEGKKEGKGFFSVFAKGIPGLGTAVAIGLGLIAEDLYQFYQGNESVAGKVSKTLEEFIGASVEFFGELFGFSKKELDRFIADLDINLKNGLRRIWDGLKSFWSDLKSGVMSAFGFGPGGPTRNRSPLIGQAPAAFGGPPAPSQLAPAGGNRTNNVNVNSPITLNLPPGMDPQQVADQVKKELDKAAGWAVDTNDPGVVY
jgi:hypothetical protein